jgi:hypothetical protein
MDVVGVGVPENTGAVGAVIVWLVKSFSEEVVIVPVGVLATDGADPTRPEADTAVAEPDTFARVTATRMFAPTSPAATV